MSILITGIIEFHDGLNKKLIEVQCRDVPWSTIQPLFNEFPQVPIGILCSFFIRAAGAPRHSLRLNMKREVEMRCLCEKVISINYIPWLFPSPERGGEGKRKRRQGKLITLPVLLSVGGLSWKWPKSSVENRFGEVEGGCVCGGGFS